MLMMLASMAVATTPTTMTLDARRVELEPVSIMAPDARVIAMTPDGEVAVPGPTISIFSDGAGTLVFRLPSGATSGFVNDKHQMRELEIDWVNRSMRSGEALPVVVPDGASAPCGAELTGDVPKPPPPHRALGANPAAGDRLVSLTIDIDQSYFSRAGGGVEHVLNSAVTTIASVSDIFSRDIGLRLSIGMIRIWPNGGEPWGNPPVLSDYWSWWQNNPNFGEYHLVHLLSGHRNTPFGGIAQLATACNDDGIAISAFLAGNAAPPNAAPSLSWWDTNVIAHEMGHNLGTWHTHDGYDPTIDDCGNAVAAPRGTIMSYCHLHPGGMLNVDLRLHRRVQDFIIATNPVGDCLPFDCNGNGTDDAQDIADGTSGDADSDGIPDECRDCNGNGVLDTLDLLDPDTFDVDGNLVPDECQPDCDGNGLPDAWDIHEHDVPDVNGNNVPDVCESDCDGNGTFDFIDIQGNHDLDLDRNAVLDSCEDCDGDPEADWVTAGGSGNYIVAGDGRVGEYLAVSGIRVASYGEGVLANPSDVTIAPDGQLWACCADTAQVARFDIAQNEPELVLEIEGTPHGLLVTLDDRLLVLDQSGGRILQYDATTGAPLGTLIEPGGLGLFSPQDLILDGDRLLITSHNTQIRAFDMTTGAFLGIIVEDDLILGADGLCVLPDGDIVVAASIRQTVRRYDGQDGTFQGDFLDEYSLSTPTDIVLLDNGHVLVPRSNQGYARIVEYRTDQTYLRSMVRGYADMSTPLSIVVRPPSAQDCDGNNRPDTCDFADGGDADGDGVLDACQCQADVNGDGDVDVAEILLIISAWGQTDSPADIDGSGQVDAGDVLMVLMQWGSC